MTSLEPDPRVIHGQQHDHPVDERIFRDLMVRYVDDLRTALFGTTPVPSVIDPDDGGQAGVSLFPARADHQHQFTSAVAAALTKTATAAEGVATTHARSDHVHSTAALPWGIVAYQEIPTDGTAFSVSSTTDFALSNVVVDATRLYAVCVESPYTMSAAGRWDLNFHVGGTQADRIWLATHAANETQWCYGRILWKPASGTVNVDLRLVEASGAATFQFLAGGFNRRFWIEDIGPR